MPYSCPDCAAQMPEDAGYCPACGRAIKATSPATGKVGVFPESIAGALAYLTFVPAIIFLVLEPFKKNRFVRFHSFQCLLFWVAGAILAALLRLAALLVGLIPVLGPLIMVLASVVAVLAFAVTWLVLTVKALQGQSFELPILGDIAGHFAAPVQGP
jgi:uncharacterized membrane protein